jgi:hypothetical protein
MLENTDGAIQNGSPEKLATQGTQNTGEMNAREYQTSNTKDNPEKLAT